MKPLTGSQLAIMLLEEIQREHLRRRNSLLDSSVNLAGNNSEKKHLAEEVVREKFAHLEGFVHWLQ